jgi:hypothetical protein
LFDPKTRQGPFIIFSCYVSAKWEYLLFLTSFKFFISFFIFLFIYYAIDFLEKPDHLSWQIDLTDCFLGLFNMFIYLQYIL